MAKSLRSIRMHPDLWAHVDAEATKTYKTYGIWLEDLVMRHKEGLLDRPASKAGRKPKDVEPEEESTGRVLPNPMEDLKTRVLRLQKAIKDNKALYESYLDQIAPEEVELEKKAWYVVEAKQKWDEAQAELDKIASGFKTMDKEPQY